MSNAFGFRQRQTGGGMLSSPPQAGDTEMRERGNDQSRPSATEPATPTISHDTVSRNDHLDVPDSIVQASYRELREDAHSFAVNTLELNEDQAKSFVRASFVAKDSRVYDLVARGDPDYENRNLHVTLTPDELAALRNEKDRLFSERGILIVSVCVAIAAFLQGHVQSSINGGTPYEFDLGFRNEESCSSDVSQASRWELGATNAIPFLTSALLGCWVSMPVNDRFGRKGAMMVAAVLVLISSLVSGLCVLIPRQHRWKLLMAIRVVNGLGMGIKAVSTPILASETAIRFFRGSFILAWQLWVACGIMAGFAVNLIFASAITNGQLAVALILGAPAVPALVLCCILPFCLESPRFYMRRDSRQYSPKKAFEILQRLRKCELLAMKDMYVLHKTIEEEYNDLDWGQAPKQGTSQKRKAASPVFGKKFVELFRLRRLRNALISSSAVNLAQQLCGINILAFYSGTFFRAIDPNFNSGLACNNIELLKRPMGLSLGFGAVNFLFGLPAIKTIDTLGRRKWLITTLPLMCIFMLMGALSFPLPYRTDENTSVTIRLVTIYLYLHAAAYSPGLGPIPFTLASESFPLSHREVGCAFAISVCYGFAGLLSLTFPSILSGLTPPGTLGLFSGLTALAFVLVILFVEETKERSLESLDIIFNYPKTQFVRYQVKQYLPWFFKRYILRERPKPERPILDFFGLDSQPDHPGGEEYIDGAELEHSSSNASTTRTASTYRSRH